MLKPVSSFAVMLFTVSSFAQPFTLAKTRLNGVSISTDSRFSNLKTESIGPTIMSGRITDIDVNPANPIEMVVAYASGGVWYTNTKLLLYVKNNERL